MPTKLISDIFPEFAVYFVKTRTINSCPPQPLQIPPFPQSNSPQTATIYPTPPPFSSHAYENNEVTSKKPKNAFQNKQLTPAEIPILTSERTIS